MFMLCHHVTRVVFVGPLRVLKELLLLAVKRAGVQSLAG